MGVTVDEEKGQRGEILRRGLLGLETAKEAESISNSFGSCHFDCFFGLSFGLMLPAWPRIKA